MKTKVNKLVKLATAGLFLIALAINVKVTLDDPFVMLSEQAIATGSSGGGSDSVSSGSEGDGNFKNTYPICLNQTGTVDKSLRTEYLMPGQSPNLDEDEDEKVLSTRPHNNGFAVEIGVEVTVPKTRRVCASGAGGCFDDGDSDCKARKVSIPE